MTISENKITGEIHGCIVCAKLYNVLVVYTPEGKLLDCTVTSPGGHIVQDEQRPLVVCDTHTEEELKFAYRRCRSTNPGGETSGISVEEAGSGYSFEGSTN